jgi:voltage-gated potassium channel
MRSSELKDTNYELFIGALSLLSIFNLVLVLLVPDTLAAQVVAIMDGFLSVIFLGDFLYRLFTSESKSQYFLRQFGWADLLASLPFPQAKILRLFRVIRVARLMRQFGAWNMVTDFVRDRAGSALLTLFFFIVLVLQFGGMAMYSVESRVPDGNIRTAFDAIWYTFVTITTVGYGDRYPVSNVGRILGMVIMVAGVGLFGTLTGYLANAFLAPQEEGAGDEEPIPATGQPADATDPKAKLAELKALLDQQQQAQAALEAKIVELETLL